MRLLGRSQNTSGDRMLPEGDDSTLPGTPSHGGHISLAAVVSHVCLAQVHCSFRLDLYLWHAMLCCRRDVYQMTALGRGFTLRVTDVLS